MKKWTAIMGFFLVWAWTGSALAADPVAGKSKAGACIGCHPVSGHHSDPEMPGVAGQRAAYTVSQLKVYRQKERVNPVMNSLAARLSEADMEDIAAYYEGLAPMKSKGDPALTASGSKKYQLCVKCHGADGSGKGPFPRLAGQQPGYILKQLRDYKEGSRKNPVMNKLAETLSEDDMKGLSSYLAGLN